MAVAPASIQVGKSYLFQPGENIRKVVVIMPDGTIQYVAHSGTGGGGISTGLVTISLDRFARDAVREIPNT